MAIITDPDNLSRFEVIFNTAASSISLYPVGSTQRNTSTSYTDVWVESSGTIVRSAAFGGSVATGDVACVMTTSNAGHYYVQNVASEVITLAEIDSGTAGAATTSLTLGENTFTAPGDVGTDQLTITAHGYNTGDQVVLDNNGNTEPTGLTNGTVYYVIRVDANTVSLASSYANAIAGTTVSITASTGSGSNSLHDRVVVAFFTNGASTSEQINGNDTSGDGTGGLLDGATLQSVYSYSKEEWRVDSISNDEFNGNYDADDYFDDLIRYEFPFEAITSEQFEVGGGTAHVDWTWFNEYTRKKVRTGGWAERNTAGTTLEEWTGVITLGTLDTDTQVYYQTDSVTTNPTDFTFLGAVNESIKVFDTSPAVDTRTYLKLFARKKARTYVQSEIADIGVTTIQTIVNRFPLSHTTDAAISANDANILSVSPWRDTFQPSAVTDAIDGSKSSGGTSFTDADATFQTWGIVNGDTLRITSGAEQGYYTISTVTSETELEIALDNEFTTSGWGSTESSLTYEIYSYYRNADKTTTPGTVASTTTAGASNGIVETGTSGVGTITDTDNGDFTTPGTGNDVVVAGDVLWITSSAGNDGLYTVLNSGTTGASDPTDTVLYVDTSDNAFPATLEAAVDYRVLTSGMYLEFKEQQIQTDLTSSGTDTMTFANADPDTITLGGTLTWDANVGPGTMLSVTGTASNDGRYTVASRDSSTVVTLVSTDTLTAETFSTTGATITVDEGFERTIGGVVYAYRWRLFGNNGTLGQCYQFVQHQLRQATDIDYGAGTSRGDITDLLMSFASPTGTTFDMYIDNLNANDINNATLQDHSETNRNFPFTASGNLVFNSNLVDDDDSKYWLFFTNDDDGDNTGRDYGTTNAIIVEDSDSTQITGFVQGTGGNVDHTGQQRSADASGNVSIPFTFAYDSNIQRGSASAGTDAPVTLVAIGLNGAQFVISTGTITRTTGITISAVAALERNYLNA